MTPLRVALAPAQAPGNPYLDDLAAALPPRRAVAVRPSWTELTRLVRPASADLVHIHWLPMLLAEQAQTSRRLAGADFLRRLAILRARRIPVVWTMHNLVSHETPESRLDRLLRRATALTASSVVVHCSAATGDLRRLWAPARAVVMPHPSHHRPTLDRGAARARLGLPDGVRVVAVPGRIRVYKDVPGVVRALRARAGATDRVMVAGEPHEPRLGDAVRDAAAGDHRLRLILRHLEDAELDDVVASADVVVLPYRRVLTSGAAVLALELGVPVVAPRLGCLPEEVGESGLLHAPLDHDAAARLALETPVDELRRRGEAGRARARTITWETAGEQLAAVYEAVARPR